MKTPFQPRCPSDGHQFYWGGSGRGVTGRCKWKGVGTGDGLGPARDVERVESNTGGIMKRVRFVQFYAILQFGTMGSIFMESGVGS